jgi:hypothetical protein
MRIDLHVEFQQLSLIRDGGVTPVNSQPIARWLTIIGRALNIKQSVSRGMQSVRVRVRMRVRAAERASEVEMVS